MKDITNCPRCGFRARADQWDGQIRCLKDKCPQTNAAIFGAEWKTARKNGEEPTGPNDKRPKQSDLRGIIIDVPGVA